MIIATQRVNSCTEIKNCPRIQHNVCRNNSKLAKREQKDVGSKPLAATDAVFIPSVTSITRYCR